MQQSYRGVDYFTNEEMRNIEGCYSFYSQDDTVIQWWSLEFNRKFGLRAQNPVGTALFLQYAKDTEKNKTVI